MKLQTNHAALILKLKKFVKDGIDQFDSWKVHVLIVNVTSWRKLQNIKFKNEHSIKSFFECRHLCFYLKN